MTTGIRKRGQILTGMRYDRVDLVAEGANGHADILIAKNKQGGSKPLVVRKSMGTYECADCGTAHASVKKSSSCSNCGSRNFKYTEVHVTKTSTPVTKQVPKNDDATNAGQYTFEDEQYDQDDGENGEALGSSTESNPVTKSGWFPVKKDGLTVQTGGDKKGRDVDSVDNEKNEEKMEGEDNDRGIEIKAMTLPTGKLQKKKKILKAENPGFNSFDGTDQGSQGVAESAEQMYRSESQPTPQAQDRRESTRSDVKQAANVGKARSKGKDGLRIMDNGAQGIASRRTRPRTGTNTGSKKKTNAGITAVSPPGNKLDKSRRIVLKKSSAPDTSLAALEALNLGVGLAENMDAILKSGNPETYEEAMKDFLETFNAAAGEWFAGSTVTKSKNSAAQAEDVASRVYDIIAKASPESEMSDDVAEGSDADAEDKVATSSVGKLKSSTVGNNENEKEQTVGKSKTSDDPYADLDPIVKAKFQRLDELEEARTKEVYLAKAKELRGLPGYNQEKIAKQLRNAYDEGQEEGDYLFQTLSASANAVQDSGIFKQLGMSGAGSIGDDDPMAQAFAYADSHISKSGDGPSREQLVADYMREHPKDFYQPAKS